MKRATGGKVVYAGGGSNVLKEAEERKRGGRVHHGEGEEHKKKGDRRARGGAVPARARGGAVGADKRPLSSAANTKKLPMEEAGTEADAHKGENVANP
jgi:hypothetical protein